MNEAVVAGAIAGAVAGVIAGAAVMVATHGLPGRGHVGQWRMGGGWTGASRVYRWQPGAAGVAPAPQTEHHSGVMRADAASAFAGFDDSARRVIDAARAEAQRLHHNYIGTEHLLLGLLVGDANGPAGRVLTRLGVTLDKARTALEFIIPRGDAPVAPGEMTVSPRARRIFDLALREAHGLGRAQAGAGELLLGLIREGQGIASGIIESLGISLAKLREAVLAEMSGQPPLFDAAGMGEATHETRGPFIGPFDRFNGAAKRVLALAQDEAIGFNHNYIGPEHVLLGLIREGAGPAARVLRSLGVELSETRRGLEQLIGRGERVTSPSEITLTPRTKKLIELAIDEARKLGHAHVATEHLLLGIVRDGGSNAGQLLVARGIGLEKIREAVIAALGRGEGGG